MRQKTQYKQHDERGMVSITVTVIFILVISLVVLGFSAGDTTE